LEGKLARRLDTSVTIARLIFGLSSSHGYHGLYRSGKNAGVP
jgi:hypothetical protein